MNSSKSCSICHQRGHNRRTCKSTTNECPICLEPSCKEYPLSPLPCGHYFHVECVQSWITQGGGCPICRDGKKKSEKDDWSGEGPEESYFEDEPLLEEIDDLLGLNYSEITRGEIDSQFIALPQIVTKLYRCHENEDTLQLRLACTYVSNMVKAYLFQEYQECVELGTNALDYCNTKIDNINRRLRLQSVNYHMVPEYTELMSVLDTL